MIKKFVLSISCALILTLVGGISTANASCGSGNVEYQGACYKKITCKNGGTQKGDKCSCKAGWSGNLCQTAKKCSYTTTKCATGYTATGKTCQSGNKKYVECKANACTGYVTKCLTGYAQSATCQSGKTKKYKCEKCASGYIKYNGKCIKKLACKNGGTQNGEKCKCKAGWSGNLCQTAKKCPYSTTKCATGYTATGKTCQGGNKKYVECKANACTGYVTKCLTGYAQSATCQSGKTKKYKCEKCASGYVKFNGKCYKKLSCKNGGTQKGDKCSCKAGWSGNLCQTANTCAYKAVSCARGYVVTETCMSGNKKYVKCAKKLDCKNGGTQNGEKCACTAGWTGADCSTKATCAYNTTKCGAGYVATGKTCQSGNTKYVECKANPCTGYVKSCPKDYYATSDTCLSGTTTMYKCKTDLTDFDKGASIVKKTLTDADNVVTWEDGDEQDITTVNNQDLKVVTNSESTVTGVLSTQDEVANAFAASGSKEVVVDIEQRGNGNVYGMRAELGAYADDGLDVDNAISGGNASVRSTIKINNKGNGNAYGMYTNTDISNPDNDGIYLSNVWADNESEGIGVIDILNSGNGYVYGIFVGETSNTDKVVEAVNAQADENALGAGMININNSGSGNVYGLRAKSWAVNASVVGDEANAEGLININNSGNGDVYAIYSDDNAQNASNNGEEAYGLVRINNSGNGNTYGLVGKVVQNAVSDSGDESTGIINIINRGNGNAYGMYSNMNGNRVFNKTNGMVSSDIEMANVGNGLAVGMYSKNGWMENSGSITIHNLGNGTAVGMMADGSTDAYNSGTITIDRESYTDEEIHVDGPDTVVVYQANSATGGQAIGIYGSADSSITNSGTIAINGTDKAYGIYSEGNDVTNTGNILINGEHTENAVKLNGGKLFQNGVLKVNAILMCKHGNQNGNSCVCDEGWSGADCNTPADCGEEYRLDCGIGYYATSEICMSGDAELHECVENVCDGYVADCGAGRHPQGEPCYSGAVAKYHCEDNDCSAYQTSCGAGYDAEVICLSGGTQYYNCMPKAVPDGYTPTACGEGYTQKGYMVSGETEYYLCSPKDCSGYEASCGDGYRATQACLSGTTPYYTCTPNDVPEGYTTTPCGEGYTQKGYVVSGTTPYYLCELNDCTGYKTSCSGGYNAIKACVSGTTQYYECEPKPVPEGYTSTPCGEGYTVDSVMLSGMTTYYLCKPNDCSEYEASCGEGYRATQACLSGTTPYYDCTPKDVPEGYTTAACGEGYTQTGYMISGTTPYYLCEEADCSAYQTSCGAGYDSEYICLSGTTRYYDCTPKAVPEGYVDHQCGTGYIETASMLSGETTYYLCAVKDCATGSTDIAGCGAGYHVAETGEYSGDLACYTCEENTCDGFDYSGECPQGLRIVDACQKGHTLMLKCEVLTVSKDPLVGTTENVNNSTITLTAEDQDVYGMKRDTYSYDVVNAYSRNGEDVEAEINITHTGNGNVYGMYSSASIYNSQGDNAVGRINIQNIGNGDIYGMYLDVASQNDYFSNAYGGTGIINIDNTGHGNVYGMYSAATVDSSSYGTMNAWYNSKGYIRIANNGVGNVYGISALKASNAYGTGIISLINKGLGNAYGLYGKTVYNDNGSVIEIANVSDGLAVGLYAKDGTIENSDTIKIHNLGNGTAVGIYADGTTTVNNSGDIIIDRNSYRDTKLTADRSDDEIYYPIFERGGKAIGIYGSRNIVNSGRIIINGAAEAYGIWSERMQLTNTGTILIDGKYTENAIRLGGGQLFQNGKLYVGADWNNNGIIGGTAPENISIWGSLDEVNNDTINLVTETSEGDKVIGMQEGYNAKNDTASITIHNTGDGDITGAYHNAETVRGDVYYTQTYGKVEIENNGNGEVIGIARDNASLYDKDYFCELNSEVMSDKTTIGEVSIINRGDGNVFGTVDFNCRNAWSLESKSYVSASIAIDNEGTGNVKGIDGWINVSASNEPVMEYDDGYISNQYVSELETVGNITIRNTSTYTGDKYDEYPSVYGLYGYSRTSNNVYNKGYNSVATAVIDITNNGSANVYGIYVDGYDGPSNAYINLETNKNNMLNAKVQFKNESDAKIVINNSGNGDVYGIRNSEDVYNLYASQLYGNSITASALIDIINYGNGSVYGIYGYNNEHTYNLYVSDTVGSDSELNSIIRLRNYGSGDAYGMNGYNNTYNSFGNQGIAKIIVENYGSGKAYGISGSGNVYNNYGNQGTAKIIVENHSSGNAYGLFKQYNEGSVYNNNSGDAKSIIEIANLSNGLAVGIYSGDSYQESTIENSGDITIHNIYDGTAVGILGLGENDSEIMTIINSGNITIDREEYVDEYGSTYSAYSETGGKAIGIYGNEYTNIINSGTITINGADAAFGIWSEGGNVTNTGTIVIDNMNCVGGDCSIYSNAIMLNGGQLFQEGILYKGADWNSSGEVSYGCVNGYWNDGYCECWDGYTGERCDQYIYDEDYCVNGDWNGDHCECWSGYTGSHCEYVQYDDCSSYTYSECPSDQHVVASCYDGNQTWYKCDYDSIDNEEMLVGSTHDVNDDVISLNNTQNRDVYGMKQSDGAERYMVNSETSGSITINNSGIGNVYGMHGGEVYNALNNGSSQNNGEINIVSSNAANVYGIYGTELAQNSNASGWTENEGTQNITYDMNATINIDSTGDGNVYGLYSEHSAYNALGSKYTTCLDEGLCYLINKNANGLININNTGNGDIYGIYATSRSSNVGTGNGTIRISNNGTGYIYGIRGQDINNASYSDDTTGRIIIINNGAGKAYGMFSQYVKNYTSEEKNVYSIIEMVNRSTGLAVGMYGNDGQIENNGEIKIHNLGNGVAVGIYADGESEVYNNGIITIDRESYTDDKGTAITTDDRIYSVTGNGGDKAIGIYGSAGSRIDNSGIIRINGAATAYGIWSEGDDVENDGIIEINGQYTANAIRLNGGQLFQNGIMKTVAEWNKTGIDGRENDGSEFICNNDEISKDSTTTGSLVGFDVIDIIGLNAYAHTQNETGVIDVTQSGTGNVFGMRGLVSTPQDEDEENYDDYNLMNAATDSAYTATGIIRVTNIGDGKKNEGVYGMYSNSHDMDVTNATYGEDTATDKTLAVGEIEVNNTGDKNVYGICSGEEGINAEGDVKGHSNGKITVINNGDGDVYGIKSYEAAYNSDATENSSAEARIVVKNIGDGNVYGMYSERSKIFNSAAGHDRGLGQTKDTATTNGLISIDNVGNGNVYGMKGILQSDYNKVIYNALSAYNSTATGRVRVSNEGTGYAYGAYGTVVYNTYVSGKYADYNPQATGTINVINRADGKSYGMCGWRVYNNSDANQTSTIEMINAGDGLAVGVYTAYNGYVENSGDIKIHNLGNGTAVGIVAEGSSTVKNSGNITIDRSTYVDGETSYSATGNGGTAIGIYGGSNSSITNSGTITINGADVAYGIWSNSGGVANTREGTIIINGTGCAGVACFEESHAIELNGGILFQDGEMIANAGEMSPMSPMSEDVDDETLETVPLDAMRTLPAANPITDEVVITPQRVAAYLNLDDFGGTVVASETSQFIVEGAIAGDLAMNNSIIENGFDTTYTVKDMIQAEDASGLRLVSQSALFDVALENDSDAVMTMKSFNDVVANQSVADFLKQNYSEGNNEDLFGMLKGKETVAALNSTLDSLTGSDVFNRFNFEDMTMMRELNMDVNHTLFNDKEDNLVTSGNVAPFYFDSESGADGKYALYNRRIGKKSFGLSLAFSNVNSSDRHDNNTRNDESFQMSVPFGYNARGFKFITAPRFGYAYGHYDRDGYESRTYKGTMEKRMFGLMNEVRYPVKLSGWKIAPAAEFNMLGYHLKGSEDVQAYSLNIKSQNNYSVEAGFGLYADKELQPTKNSTLKLNAGVAMYHEFADPYTMELGMHGMNGSFKIRDERRKDNRAVLRTGFDYSLGDITVEGSVASFIDGTTHTKAGLDLRYNF